MQSPKADQNLLYGVLALQMDFVTSEQLISTMNCWMLDKSKSLGMLLVEQGVLAEDTDALLCALVKKHVEQHGGDPGEKFGSRQFDRNRARPAVAIERS